MIGIQQYADEHKITYEAVRQKLIRYAEELDGHIVKQKNKKYLDDFAVSFLDGKSKESPVVVISKEVAAARENLEEKYTKLLEELHAVESQYRTLSGNHAALMETNVKLQLQLAEHNQLAEENEKLRAGIQVAENAAKKVSWESSQKDLQLQKQNEEIAQLRGALTAANNATQRAIANATELQKAQTQLDEIKAMSPLQRLFWRNR